MNALRHHYPEYGMEAAGLGLFMMAASILTVLVEHPASLIRQAMTDPLMRRAITGMAMGLTAIAIINSPWGKQSGAHLNPAVTLTFFRLGKIKRWDAVFYILAQFLGGLGGVWIAAQLLPEEIAHPTVNYVVTQPGTAGPAIAFGAELVISFGLMLMVLFVSNHPSRGRYTSLCVGMLIAIYVTLEAPLSGTSMNPARTMASALPAQTWTAIWIYFTAPLIGMLLAAEVYVRLKGRQAVRCAKLHHGHNKRCIFHCGYRGSSQDLHLESTRRLPLSDRLPRP